MKLLFPWLLLLPCAASAVKPNVVLVLVDDFGYECVGANGGESYRTPVLDRLAAGGVRFERCHAQPLCTPTRIQLMTGKSNIRNYVDFGTFPPGETTFAAILKQAGYATGIAGKWQLGRDKDLPRKLGFDEACLWQHTRRPPRYANPGLEYDGVEKDFTSGEYGPDLVDVWARDFIERRKAGPFLLYYPMMLTHDPFQPTPDSPDWDPGLKGEQKKRDERHFGEMVAYLDKLLGKLVEQLKASGVLEHTLLIVMGDNGTGTGVTSRFQGGVLKGGKGTTTHRGTHVPLIVSWPGRIREGRVDPGLACSTDLLPTICEAAGLEAPAGIDGISLLPRLEGARAKREWIYSWYSPRQGGDKKIREFTFDAGHKLYREGSLYDLAADPEERAPLPADAAAGARAKLQAALDRFKDARLEK